jgi:YebC/PmpR family DNA-binding regulatory protein
MGRKWNNIKEKKASKDASRSKVLAKFGKLIYAAAKKGDPDPEINRGLAEVIARAKTYNVNRDIIDRAIKKAKESGGEEFQTLRYEGYGIRGSAVIVETLTDNVNRTASEVRSTFTKHQGNLGVNGSVSFMFQRKGIIAFPYNDEEQLLNLMIDNDIDVEQIEQEESLTILHLPLESFHAASQVLTNFGIRDFQINEVQMIASDEIKLSKEDQGIFEKMIDTLEDLDDVQAVYHNVELD